MKNLLWHLLFWIFTALYVADYFIDVYPLKEAIFYTGFEVLLFGVGFYGNLLLLLPRFFTLQSKFKYIIFLLILLSLICSLYYWTGLAQELLAPSMTRATISFFLNHAIFIMLSYVVWYYDQYVLEKERRLQLEFDKLQTELLLLKSQISPHFLFNSLNNLYALMINKSEDAPKMLVALSDLLRYFLYKGSEARLPLSSELKAIEHYLSIQRFRALPGSKNISLTCDNDVKNSMVPPLIFMTLVENAFKHGNIAEQAEGFVSIKIEYTQGRIAFKIRNSYSNKETGSGMGQENLKSQLEILFKRRYDLNISINHNVYEVNLVIDAYGK